MQGEHPQRSHLPAPPTVIHHQMRTASEGSARARHAVVVEPRDGAQLLGERVTDALDAYRSGARTPLAEFGGDDPVTGERARLAPRVAALLAGRPDLIGGQRLYPWEVCNVSDIELGWSIAWVDGAYRLRRRSHGVVSEGAAGPSAGELMDRLEGWLLDS